MVAKNDKCSKCLQSFIRERHSWKSRQKNNLFWSANCFFCRGTHECYSLMKLGRHLKHLSFFATNFFWSFWIFLDFTIHGGSIRAKTEMGTFQHFFHECKWHWHIGVVFLNILVSYLHFFDLVWISYEVFKVRSNGQREKA